MAQFFGVEEIKELTKTSQTTLEWTAGSVLRIGGQGYNISSALTLNLATDIDTGSVANDTIYYVYAVVVAGIVNLKYSLSDTAPTGFTAYRKIGAFQTNGSAELIETSTKDYGSVGDVIQSMLTEEQFVKENGAGWILADGRSVVGSKLHTLQMTSSTPVQNVGFAPDLRGRFLRGRNNGRVSGANPDGEFNLGQEQGDGTRNPGFTYADTYMDYIQARYPRSGTFNGDMTIPRSGWSPLWQTGNGSGPAMSTQLRNNQSNQSISGGNNETRAANTTVNFFIKINDIAI